MAVWFGVEMVAEPQLLTIGEVAELTGMGPSRIRYYESIGLLPAPERVAGKRRYTDPLLRRLTIIDAAQRVGFTLGEIRELLGSREQLAQERLRQLALSKLPQLDDLIEQATSVRRLLQICSRCNCQSIDLCRMLDERALPHFRGRGWAASSGRRTGAGLTSTQVEVQSSRRVPNVNRGARI